MSRQFVYRLLQGLFTMWAVVTVVFLLMRVTGDPIEMRFAGDPRPEAQLEAEALRHTFGLDRPLPEQYVNYLLDVLRFDFGNSMASGRPVATMIQERLPHTLRVTLTAFLASYLISVPLGVFIAIKRDTFVDYGALVLSMMGVSIPVFWLGILLILFFSVRLEVLPALGVGDGSVRYLVLPVLTLVVPRAAFMTRFIRGTMLDVLNEDYLRTARSKGLRERTVIFGHALRNALLPIITVAGVQLGYLVSGSVVIERVFGLPGIGDMLVDSISARDFPVTQAIVLMLAASIVIMNLVVDLLYVYIDPRVGVGDR